MKILAVERLTTITKPRITCEINNEPINRLSLETGEAQLRYCGISRRSMAPCFKLLRALFAQG